MSAVALFVALVALGAAIAVAAGRGHHISSSGAEPAPAIHSAPVAPPAAEAATGAWTAVTPATLVPAQTPVQQQTDQALAADLSISPTVIAAETAQTPRPAVSISWPALPATIDSQQWARAFTTRLLSIDFARQSRVGLGGWLSAEEAPELLPGVPLAAQDKVLYMSLFEPTAAGNVTSPIPSDAQWATLASQRVVWSASDLLVQPDPKWSQIIASGWQPTDSRFGVLDLSGLLSVRQGETTTSHTFSMTLYTGSAHWQPGYGTVVVSNWSEN